VSAAHVNGPNNRSNARSDFQFFARVPKAVYLARKNGEITALMFEILALLHLWADRNTGVVRSFSPGRILEWMPDEDPDCEMPSERTVQRHTQGLRAAGWLLSDYRKGQKRPYALTLTNFLPAHPEDAHGDADGDGDKILLNPSELKHWMKTNAYQGADRDADTDGEKTLRRRREDAEKAAKDQSLSDFDSDSGSDSGFSLNPASKTAESGGDAGADEKAGVDADNLTPTTSLVDVGNGKGAGNKGLNPANQSQAERDERAEILIASTRRKQLDRAATDEDIFREYDSVWKRLQREHKAKEDFEPKSFHDPSDPRAAGLVFDKGGRQKYAENPAWEAMPEGADWEGDLFPTTNKKQRHDAADLYRAIGQADALAEWRDFLINTNPEIKVGAPIFDSDTGEPTGKCYSTVEQIAHPLYNFVRQHSVSASAAKS
jgi:hypothetical protein